MVKASIYLMHFHINATIRLSYIDQTEDDNSEVPVNTGHVNI